MEWWILASVFLGYVLLLLFGALVVPMFASVRKLARFLAALTRFETNRRDKRLKRLTLFLINIGFTPNAITLMGFLLVAALAWLFWHGARLEYIFAVALLAALTDLFDGMVARVGNMVTPVGGVLDGLRDVLLFIVFVVGVLSLGLMPLWLFGWFMCGVAVVELAKVIEVVKLRHRGGLWLSWQKRLSGHGKLAIDRAKFFLFMCGFLALVWGELTHTTSQFFVSALFAAAFLALALSLLSHGIRLRLVWHSKV